MDEINFRIEWNRFLLSAVGEPHSLARGLNGIKTRLEEPPLPVFELATGSLFFSFLPNLLNLN